MQSYRHPAAIWKPSPNFFPNRHGHDMAIQPAWVVLHTMVGTEASAWARFQQASQQASSHYGIRLDGRLVQYVDEKDAAWTDGTNVGTGAHDDSVTIEHEDGGDYDGPRTPALYRTSAILVRQICQRYGIPIDRQHVIKHLECTNAATACPDSLDVDRIVRMAAGTEPLPGDEAMTPAERTEIGRALVRIVYEICRHGEPESQAVLGDWAAKVAPDFDAGVATLFDTSPEFLEGLRIDREVRSRFAAGELGDVGPAGPPGPAGPGVTDEHIVEAVVERLTS